MGLREIKDDEHMTILIDGEAIGSFNHDQHGWVGMGAVENIVKKIAEKLGVEVEETD